MLIFSNEIVIWFQIERVELRLRTETLGFTGLGFFTITKSYLLNVVNVIFTFEIVLLQSSSAQ